MAFAGFCVCSASAAWRTWKSSPEDNWNWTNPNNFEEGTAPAVGDTILVRVGREVHVKADDAESWNLGLIARAVAQAPGCRSAGSGGKKLPVDNLLLTIQQV